MKKLFLAIPLLAAATPFCAQSQQNTGTLAGFLAKQGLGGAKLERRVAIICLFRFPLTTGGRR
jgi:hypothetical protein